MPAADTLSADDILLRVDTLRESFWSGRTKPIEWRLQQLRSLQTMLEVEEDQILDAIHQDLGKPRNEAWMTEVALVRAELRHVMEHLEQWMRPRKVNAPLVVQPAKAEIVAEPVGVVLIVAPWNYPFMLCAAPAMAALAAGNCVCIKPSEHAPATSALLATLFETYFDPKAVAVLPGAIETTKTLLSTRFDHIFFTGSTRVGKIVMEAASRYVTPVTLELGGKSPAIVDRSADIATAAKRLIWGKYVNLGQTCTAPDYVLVHSSKKAAFVEACKGYLKEFFGDNPQESPDLGRIVSDAHVERLAGLFRAEDVLAGGEIDPSERYIAPTLLDADPEHPSMQEEIFGPMLPIMTYDELDRAIDFVNRGEKPLALYVFASDRIANKVLAATSSGTACVNDCMVQWAVYELPFGGVGKSGFGSYHSEYGFLRFSHQRSVLRKGTRIDPTLRYPPYGERRMKILRRIY